MELMPIEQTTHKPKELIGHYSSEENVFYPSLKDSEHVLATEPQPEPKDEKEYLLDLLVFLQIYICRNLIQLILVRDW